MSSQFAAGAAARQIIPDHDMLDRTRNSHLRFDCQGSPLYAKSLVMGFGQKRVILIALDICGLKEDHCNTIRQSVVERLQQDNIEVIISASHSHSAPCLRQSTEAEPFFDCVLECSVEAAVAACEALRPARFGHGCTCVVGASFNQRFPLPAGGVEFTRDFRRGLSSGRPVDPRLNVIRIDDENGKPIAGWIRFAAHPACVIFDATISAEYPGYMTERLSETIANGVPVLFGYGASGDVNCVPMFGRESDSRNLGYQLADLASKVFEKIETQVPYRLETGSRTIDLPLDPPPSVETLDKEILEVRTFIENLDTDPHLEWVMGISCVKDWPVSTKKAHVAPLVEWAELMKAALRAGRKFPTTWASEITTLIIDDLGLVFYPGEPFTELGLSLASRSCLQETLLISLSNGALGYIGTDEDHRRGGYETYTSCRYTKLAQESRPLPYASDAGECLLDNCLTLINELSEKKVER